MQNLTKEKDVRSRSYIFSLNVISLLDTLPKKNSAWIISDQVARSSMSIGANLVEAKGSGTRKEFKRFFEIALKSANESTYWLGLLKDSKLASVESIAKLEKEVDELSRVLATSVIKLKSK